MRDCGSDEGEGIDPSAEPRTTAECRHDPQSDPDGRCQYHRPEHQGERHGETRVQESRDRRRREEGCSERSVQHPVEPVPVLDVQGLVEPELVSEQGVLGLGAGRPEHGGGRVSRGDRQKNEGDQRNDEQKRDRPQQALNDYVSHTVSWIELGRSSRAGHAIQPLYQVIGRLTRHVSRPAGWLAQALRA